MTAQESTTRKELQQPLGQLAILLVLLIPGLQPLLSRQLTCGFDNNFHFWRSVQIGALLEEGILFSRWAPHMAQGFGYPLYLFQSPFSAYLTAVFHLVGFSWPVALNIVYAIGFVGAALAMWLLAWELWGSRGAMVAAVAYAYAPFHAYVVFYRASLSETVAWLFPPLILWGLRRWQLHGSRKGLLTAVFSFLLLVWTHDVTAYALFPLFIGWVAVQNRPWYGALAFGLGFASSAFFWLPALAERSAIQFDRANSAWPFLYFNNFLPLTNFLALPRNADPTLLNDWPPRALGALLLLLALAGGLVALRHATRQRQWLIALLLTALAGYIFLILPLSRPLWDTFSPLAAFQFPWRFLAPATLIAALLAGGLFKTSDTPVQHEPKRKRQSILFLGTVGVLSLGHWGWFYPQHCDAPENPTVAGMVAWEEATLTTGTTAKDELRPVTVQRRPPAPGTSVWENRFPADQLPDGATIHTLDIGTLGAAIELQTAVPFTATYQAYAFPGWQLKINGRSIPITPSDPHGLITFPVPAGDVVIELSFGETPLRLAADAISLVSVAVVLGVVIIGWGQTLPPAPSQFGREGSTSSKTNIAKEPTNIPPRIGEGFPTYPTLLIFAIALALLKIGVVDQEWTPLRSSRLNPDNSLTNVAVTRNVTFGSVNRAEAKLALLGYDALETAVSVNDHLETVLYWQPLDVAGSDYRVGLALVDENGLRWSEAGLRDARWYRNPPPTRNWDSSSYALTAYWLDQLPGTPPGRYTLELSVFDRQTLAPLTIFDETGQPLGPTMPIGQIELTKPKTPWTADLVAMQYPLANCETAVSPCLWGSNVDRAEAAPGDSLLVTLFYSELQTANLMLIDEQGEVATQWLLTFPELEAGLWRQQEQLRLPVTLANGRYRWVLEGAGETAVSWGDLTVTAPERILTPPSVAQPSGETFGEQITLYGATISSNDDQTIDVTLIWRAEQLIDDSYHVFLHLLDADGNLIAQSDGIPAGNRPTTGWLPGEYIDDTRQLILPTSITNYAFRVGLYKPGASRLTTSGGQDFITLSNLP